MEGAVVASVEPVWQQQKLWCGSITRGHRDWALPWLAGSAPPLCRSVVWGCSPLVDASFQAAPDLLDLDRQLGHRRLSGGPARGHPFPMPSLQTPIGSLPLTGSASRRAMPLGSWMSKQSREGWQYRIAPDSGSSRSSIPSSWALSLLGKSIGQLLGDWSRCVRRSDRSSRPCPHSRSGSRSMVVPPIG